MFAAEGTRVVVVGRRAEPLAETAAGHDLIHPLPADITGEGAAEEIVRHVVETHGRLDVLVNNAAIVQSATLDATTPEAMDATSGTCWRRGSRSTTSGRSPRAWTAT
jgi:NAD(P)-dependent dehydrogenase (short-subunit alcohol dehydrogenase family)